MSGLKLCNSLVFMFAGFCLPNYCIYEFTRRAVSPFCQAQRWSGQGHLTTSRRGRPGHDTGLPGRSPSRRTRASVPRGFGARYPCARRHRQAPSEDSRGRGAEPTHESHGWARGRPGWQAGSASPSPQSGAAVRSREHKAAGPGTPRSCTHGRAPPGESSACKSPGAAVIHSRVCGDVRRNSGSRPCGQRLLKQHSRSEVGAPRPVSSALCSPNTCHGPRGAFRASLHLSVFCCKTGVSAVAGSRGCHELGSRAPPR